MYVFWEHSVTQVTFPRAAPQEVPQFDERAVRGAERDARGVCARAGRRRRRARRQGQAGRAQRRAGAGRGRTHARARRGREAARA